MDHLAKSYGYNSEDPRFKEDLNSEAKRQTEEKRGPTTAEKELSNAGGTAEARSGKHHACDFQGYFDRQAC